MEETTKEKLEIEKLKLEIKNERKPFYVRISFYAALSPIIVSIVAIVYSIATGFFENESTLLELRKENLRSEINIFIKQKDSLSTSVNTLKAERDSLSKSYNSISKEKKSLELILVDNKRTIEAVSKNIIQLSISDYINRMKSVTQTKIETSTNDVEEADKWIKNFNNKMRTFIKECIVQSSGSGNDPRLKLIPDSIKTELEKKSIVVINDINPEYFKYTRYGPDLVSLLTYSNDVLRYRSECNAEKINSDLSELNRQIQSEENKEKRGDLALDYLNLNLESADCLNRLNRSINTLKTEIINIKINIINEFVDLLHKKLNYKDD